MPANSNGVLRPAQDLWRRTIAQIPTHFGRLCYLASLRDPHTGKYFHENLSHLLGNEDADRMLCHAHHKIFSEWLCFSLAEQKSDLDEFMGRAGKQVSLRECRDLAPTGARDVERQLYLTDLETILELMRFGQNYASGNPET